MELDLEVAFATFAKRFRENVKNREFDNSRLPAGSYMHYFCHGCYIKVASLPEGWFMNGPPKYCDACRVLADHGLLTEAQQYVEQQIAQAQPPQIEEQKRLGSTPRRVK